MRRATFGGAAVVALALSLYEAAVLVRQDRELEGLSAEAERLTGILQELNARRTATAARLQQIRTQLAEARPAPAAPAGEIELAGEGWIRRVNRLRQLATERPALVLPEFELLGDGDWFTVAKDAKLETDEDVRAAFKQLRDAAKKAMGRLWREAISSYVNAHGGVLPVSAGELVPSLKRTVPAPALARYEMIEHGALSGVRLGEPVLAERLDAPGIGETRLVVSTQGAGIEDLTTVSDREMRQALRAYRGTHDGRWPTEPAQLLGYFKTPPAAAAQKNLLAKPPSDFTAAELKKLLPEPP